MLQLAAIAIDSSINILDHLQSFMVLIVEASLMTIINRSSINEHNMFIVQAEATD
jgi:hypothetical protein